VYFRLAPLSPLLSPHPPSSSPVLIPILIFIAIARAAIIAAMVILGWNYRWLAGAVVGGCLGRASSGAAAASSGGNWIIGRQAGRSLVIARCSLGGNHGGQVSPRNFMARRCAVGNRQSSGGCSDAPLHEVG